MSAEADHGIPAGAHLDRLGGRAGIQQVVASQGALLTGCAHDAQSLDEGDQEESGPPGGSGRVAVADEVTCTSDRAPWPVITLSARDGPGVTRQVTGSSPLNLYGVSRSSVCVQFSLVRPPGTRRSG